MIDKSTIDKMYLIYRKSCDVINFLRGGLQESAYHAALEWELTQAGMKVFNYMRLTQISYGMLINFGQDSIITVERYHYSPQENKILLMDKYGNEIYQKE